MNAQATVTAADGLSRPAQPIQIRKILVPMDFSDGSRKALNYALALAQQFSAELVLVHIVQLNYQVGEFGAVDFPLIESQSREHAGHELKEISTEVVRNRVPVRTSVLSGQPVPEIVLAAQKAEADLIVISTHGRTGLKHVLLGSTAEEIVRHAPCPVLVVRENERDFVAD